MAPQVDCREGLSSAPTDCGITFLHGGSLGDFLLSLALLHRLARTAPACRVCVIARAPMSRLPAAALGFARLLDADSLALHRLFTENEPLCDELVSCLGGCDLLIDALTSDQTAAHDRLRRAAGGRVVALDPRPDPNSTKHIVDQWAATLAANGVSVNPSVFAEALIRLDAQTPRDAGKLLRTRCGQRNNDTPNRRWVLLHPGSGGRRKCWPLERFIALAGMLAAEGCTPVFLVGPTEQDWYGRSWTLRLAASGPVVYEPDLLELLRLVRCGDLYVGNDAGSTHLAAAVGVPTLALFGPTDPRVWRPPGPAVDVLAPPAGPTADMSWLPVKRVYARCLELLAARTPG